MKLTPRTQASFTTAVVSEFQVKTSSGVLALHNFLSTCVNFADCGSEVMLRPGDIVICRECGYRILYKKRTKQSAFTLLCSRSHDDIFSAVVQFEAR